MSIISSKEDYSRINVDNIPVTGEILPIREMRNTGLNALKAEDLAFLSQGAADRARALKASREPVDPVEPDAHDSGFHLALRQENRRCLQEIAGFYGARATAPSEGVDRGAYCRYVDPSAPMGTADGVLPAEFAEIAGTWNAGAVETWLLRRVGLAPDAFRPRNDAAARYDRGVNGPALDVKSVRDGFADLMRLRRLVAPVNLVGGEDDRPIGVVWQDSEYDQSESTGELHRANLRFRPVLSGATFDFATTQCFCAVPADGDSAATVYMSEKSVYVTADPPDWGDPGAGLSSTCCADHVDVSVERPGSFDVFPDGPDRSLLIPERIYLVFRCWNYNTPSQPPGGRDERFVLASDGLDGWRVDGGFFRSASKFLSAAGLQTSAHRMNCVDDASDRRIAAHICSVGVDLFFAFAVCRLGGELVRTDVSETGWSP